MKKLIALLAVGVGIGAVAPAASAAGCSGPNCGGNPPSGGPLEWLFAKKPVPAFQAAPWYLYWPYQGHFMTPAPLGGAYYGAPAGGGVANPYFPANPAYYPVAPGYAPAPAMMAPAAQ